MWKYLHGHTLPEFVPRTVLYPEYYSSGITHVMEGDEVEKRAKKWLKFRILMLELLFKEFVFQLRKQLGRVNKISPSQT